MNIHKRQFVIIFSLLAVPEETADKVKYMLILFTRLPIKTVNTQSHCSGFKPGYKFCTLGTGSFFFFFFWKVVGKSVTEAASPIVCTFAFTYLNSAHVIITSSYVKYRFIIVTVTPYKK